MPTAIKDLNLTAGVRTTLGSRVYEHFVPPVDDHVVELLRRAGTISLGKTNTPEFGLPCYTEPVVAPPARTPWDPSRSAGGSSGGAGAAVAAGMVPFAQGSDGGGSMRIPASVSGLVGIKPSRGRVSNGPVGGDVTGLAWNGPLARTVRDAAALLDAMAVPMPGDPHWAPPLAGGETFLSYAGRDPGKLRIGRWATPVVAQTEVHPDCLAAYEEASRALVELGHEVEDVDAPFPADVTAFFETVWGVASQGAPVDPGREGELQPLTRWLRERGAATSGPEFVQAMARLQMLTRQWIVRTAGYDALLSPTLASPPVPVGHFTAGDDPAEDFARQKRFAPFTAVYNVTGQPAVIAAAALDRGHRRAAGAADRRHAGRPAGAGGNADHAVRAAGGRPALGATGDPPAGRRIGGPGRCRPRRVRYRSGVTVWETVLVFGVLPLAGLAVLALLTFAPGAARSPRYRVGQPWEHEPVWYVARPDVDAPAGSAEGRAAIAAAGGRRELPGGVPAPAPSSVLDARTGTARGGANGEW